MMAYSRQFRVLIILVAGMVAGTVLYRYSFDRSSVYKRADVETSSDDHRPIRPVAAAASGSVVQMRQENLPLVGAHHSSNIEKDINTDRVKIVQNVPTTKPTTAAPTTTTVKATTTTTATTTATTTTAKPTTTVKTTSPRSSTMSDSAADDALPVPRIVHYTWYSTSKLVFRFHHFMSILSAYKHIKPKKIMFWYEIEPQGPWWKEINTRVPVIELMYRKAPTEIFGKKISVSEHQTDVVRLEAVMQYGGIYTDLDVIITKSFDPLRKYNTTMGYELPGGLCNGIIISAPNAPFLKIWHETYHTFNDGQWAYHSVQLPATLAKQHPDLIHTELDTLHRPNWIEKDWLYKEGKIWDWSKNYAVHLWYRFHNIDHNPEDIKKLNTTMGQLFRYTYYGTKDIITT